MSKYKDNLTEKERIEYELFLREFKNAADDGLETVCISIKDGFYTIFADDAKEAGYEVLNVSKGYFNGYISVYLKKRTENTTVDWQQVRIQAAITAMQGILASKTMMEIVEKTVEIGELHGKEVSVDSALSEISVGFADALIKKLKK